MAQDNLWVNGSQVLDFNKETDANNVPLAPLKTCLLPIGPNSRDYQGQTAAYAQNAQYDENGKLLFFVVDGTIYDHQGYLMADNDASPNCHDCLMKGIQQISIVLIPGTCDKYYIISGDFHNEQFNIRSQVGYSVLDLSMESRYYGETGIYGDQGRKGGVWHIDDLPDDLPTEFMARLLTQAGLSYTPEINIANFAIATGEYAVDDEGNWGTYTKGGNIYHIVWDSDIAGRKTIFAQNSVQMLYGKIGSNGIETMKNLTGWTQTDPADNALNMTGELAITLHPSGGIRLASPVNTDATVGPNDLSETLRLYNISWSNFIPFTPSIASVQFIHTNTQSVTNGQGRVHGMDFSPSGQYLYFTQPFPPYIGYVDMLDPTLTVHDVGAELGLPAGSLSSYGYGHIRYNWHPTSANQFAMYFPNAGGIGYLEYPDQPGTGNWIAAMPANSPASSVWAGTTGVGNFTQYLMDMQNYNDQQLNGLGQHYCCQDNEQIPEWSHVFEFGGINSQALPWTPQLNPLTSPLSCPPSDPTLTAAQLYAIYGHVYFEEDFVVQTGARLFVKNMDWRFAPNAKLIIERGAFVNFNNCILQGTLDANCEPQRWPGIRVEGTTTASQFPTVNGAQGYLYLANTTVANAHVGVWCERESGNYPAGGYAGGIVRAYSSTIKNCLTGVRIANYPNSQHSSFTTTTFITDTDRPDLAPPYANALISSTRTVFFNNCSFLNQSGDPALMNGIGVLAFNGQVNVNGGTIDDLAYGVVNVAGALAPSTVNNVHFTRNVWGIYDLATSYSRYTNNQFDVPGDGNTMTPSVGMYLWQPQGYTIERNTFNGDGNSHNVGIYFKGISSLLDPNSWVYTDNQIYNNTFTGLYAGAVVKDIHRGGANTQNDAGLSLFCGDFTNDIYDIALLESSIIKPDQGYPGDQLSGNRFLTTANCTNTWDWNLDPAWNQVPGWYNNMHLTVFRNEDPLCDVRCEWPDFADIPVPNSGLWTEGGLIPTCGDGILDHEHTIPGDVVLHHLAKSQLDAALDAYNGNLDAGEKPDLIDLLIEQEPPLPSSTLRNTLLANSPLSDDVLVTMLKREPALDPWHLTQVLVANVKLNPGVLDAAKYFLSPFYFGVVMDAQEGSGVSWKQLMEQEIELRRAEKARALASLGYLYGTDSTYEGGVDSLRMLLATDSDPNYTQVRTAMYINDNDWGAAEAELNGPGGRLNGAETYVDLLDYGTEHEGQWSQLTGGQRDVLVQHMHADGAGAALAGGILFSHKFTDYIPEVQFPRQAPAQMLVPVSAVTTHLRPALALYPNPASTEAYLKWPTKQKGDVIKVMDAQGRILLEHQATENGLSRLDLTELPVGLYKAYLNGSGLSVSFSIVR